MVTGAVRYLGGESVSRADDTSRESTLAIVIGAPVPGVTWYVNRPTVWMVSSTGAAASDPTVTVVVWRRS